jgi:hypothetical protein
MESNVIEWWVNDTARKASAQLAKVALPPVSSIHSTKTFSIWAMS